MPHRSRKPGGGRADCMQQGQRAGLKDSRQLKSGLWSWEFYTMWTGHLLPPPSASSSVKQRKTGVWYELATSGENTDIQAGQVCDRPHTGQQAASLASALSLFRRQHSAVWSQAVSPLGLSFLLHQVEAAGWGWNGHSLSLTPPPPRPMRSQSGCKTQISELFWSLKSPMAVGSQSLSSQAAGPSM